MTGFLASVASVAEARIALAGGADIIDLKDPRSGALGALPGATVAAAVRAVAGRALTSATIGDLAPEAIPVAAAVRDTLARGVDIVKIGLFPGKGDVCALIDSLGAEAARRRLVAVLFADRQPDLSLLPRLADNGFYGVMLDTATKQGSGLCAALPRADIARFVTRAQQLGLVSGLAGQLTPGDIPALLALQPDYLGFRSALCVQQARGRALDARAVEAVRRRIPRQARAQPPAEKRA